MTETRPGLAEGPNGTQDSVLKTSSITHNHSKPRAPIPRWLMTDAALVLKNSLSPWSVSRDDCPTMGVMVGCGKPSMILSMDAMVGFRQSLVW